MFAGFSQDWAQQTVNKESKKACCSCDVDNLNHDRVYLRRGASLLSGQSLPNELQVLRGRGIKLGKLNQGLETKRINLCRTGHAQPVKERSSSLRPANKLEPRTAVHVSGP